MAVSDRFAELTREVETAAANIRAAAAEDDAALKSRVADARKSADEHADQFRAMTEKTGEEAQGHWQAFQSSWDQHIQHIRQRIDEKKAEHDVKVAEREAEAAESDALAAIDFAAAAIDEAEYAVLDAALARVDADALAASSS